MTNNFLDVNGERLLQRIFELGEVGRDQKGRLMRLAATKADRAGRDTVIMWFREAGLEIAVDQIGNLFGIWRERASFPDEKPIMIGSHIDSVINAGIYDGSYGVLAGLEVIKTLQASGFTPKRPIVVATFANEEGVRYAPDMMGSLVYVGGMEVEEALKTVGIDGTIFGEELRKIGYAGDREPGFIQPEAYVELHIEQGPVLDHVGDKIGAVENLQGISWQKVTVEGSANHAGTTPMNMRRDAGRVVTEIQTFLYDYVKENSHTVLTFGSIEYEPNLINVIPERATFTMDLRDPDDSILQDVEAALSKFIKDIAKEKGVKIEAEQLARFKPVEFSESIVKAIEEAAVARGLKSRRMTSGAGHDAQMMARICPTAMIFVPSIDGISHNPKEHTEKEDLIAGANVLLDVVKKLSEA